MASKFERFTERARKVFSYAQEEAQHMNHTSIGTEHLLLGLIRQGDGIAARVLTDLGVQLPRARAAVRDIVGEGKGEILGNPELTPRAKKVIELAMDEARRLSNHYIGTEHLLLGLVREGEGIAAGILENLGVHLDNVRQSVMHAVSQSPADQQAAASTIICRVDLPIADYLRLRGIAKRSERTVDDLIPEAVQYWLVEQGKNNDNDPPLDAEPSSPPPQLGGS